MGSCNQTLLNQFLINSNHFQAITGYRETEKLDWSSENQDIIERVRLKAFGSSNHGDILPSTHILDLASDGVIKPHVDSVRFCGDTIAGHYIIIKESNQ